MILAVENEAIANQFADGFVCLIDCAGNRPQAKDNAINFAWSKPFHSISVQKVLPQIIDKQNLRAFAVDLLAIQIDISFFLKQLHYGHFKRMLIEVSHYNFPLSVYSIPRPQNDFLFTDSACVHLCRFILSIIVLSRK